MRIAAKYEGEPLVAERRTHLHSRVRWALGGLSSVVAGISLRFFEVEDDVTCRLTIRLRDGDSIRLVTYGRTFEEVVDFIAGRACDAVSRQLGLEKRSRR